MGCLVFFIFLMIIIAGIVVGNIFDPLYGWITGFGLLASYVAFIYLQHRWVDIRGLNIDIKKHQEKEKKYLEKKRKYLEEREAKGRGLTVNDMLNVKLGDKIELIYDSRFYIEPGATGTVIKVEVPFEEMKDFYECMNGDGMNGDGG